MTKYVVFCYYVGTVLIFVVSWMTLIYYNYAVCLVCGATMVYFVIVRGPCILLDTLMSVA